MHLSPYHSVVGVNSFMYYLWFILVEDSIVDGHFKCCAFIKTNNVTVLHSNSKLLPTYFDHSSLKRRQILTATMKLWAKMYLKAHNIVYYFHWWGSFKKFYLLLHNFVNIKDSYMKFAMIEACHLSYKFILEVFYFFCWCGNNQT